MKTYFKLSGLVLLFLLTVLAVYLLSLRFSDGPVEFYPWFTISYGGPFRTGELTTAPSSWESIKDFEEIEFQTLQPAISRTVWLSIYDGRLFIVSGYMRSGLGRLWKQWPHYIEDDDRIILRIADKLYEQRMERILEGPEVVPVMTELSRKYGNGGPGSSVPVEQGFVWMFEVLPRQ